MALEFSRDKDEELKLERARRQQAEQEKQQAQQEKKQAQQEKQQAQQEKQAIGREQESAMAGQRQAEERTRPAGETAGPAGETSDWARAGVGDGGTAPGGRENPLNNQSTHTSGALTRVHQRTIGLQNDKVSYRNYRAAARAIFTLIRAFCPPEDDVYGNNTPSARGAGAFQRCCGGRVHTCGEGSFQKASVDEAYLEPARRTLTAELLSSEQHQGRPAAKGQRRPTAATETSAGAAERLVAGIKRPRTGDNSVFVAGHGDYSSLAPACSKQRREWGESQYGHTEGDRHEWDVTVGYGSSIDDDEQSDEWGRKRRREHDDVRDVGEDEDRLLEAGGLLGKRIQKTLRDVLNYDCSVGVASNKFLAKLATSLAKPKGVRVLLRRDVPSLLASTPATKIPGCGTGSAAARHFLGWGVRSVFDLRQIEAAELRKRLGEQLGAKVFDRCRGVDNDPVEPDPIPSRVSSQLSLVPLITPARCLGRPGEVRLSIDVYTSVLPTDIKADIKKLTPVFPWEVKRVEPFLVTLVDDLMDRMKEELEERNRRPTKLCIEHHLHRRGSKSQTFALRARPAPRARTRYTTPTSPAAGVVDERQERQDVAAPEPTGETEDAESPGDLGLPSAQSLVELALTPFKNYQNSRTTASGGGAPMGNGARREAATGENGGKRAGAGGGDNCPCDTLPPVVKLNISLLGFENVGRTQSTAAPPGQRTLRDMMWLEKPAAKTDAGAGTEGRRRDGNNLNTSATPPRKNDLPRKSAVADTVEPSPVAQTVAVRSVNRSGVINSSSPTQPCSLPKASNTIATTGDGDSPPTIAEQGSVLVRCPRCKACLPVGEAWDAHREAHLAVSPLADDGKDVSKTSGQSTRPHQSDGPASVHPPDRSFVTTNAAVEPCAGNEGQAGGCVAFEDNDFRSDSAFEVPLRGRAGSSGDGRDELWRSRKLSDLLMLAVSPEQAADVLKQRGLLRDDGQTRFASLHL
ncbi:unnamed protein product [Ectocarpus sp. CCAP 1310/34]|nr:unnamed protein product [Ectocarpus sp. CCAP 1310/34]